MKLFLAVFNFVAFVLIYMWNSNRSVFPGFFFSFVISWIFYSSFFFSVSSWHLLEEKQLLLRRRLRIQQLKKENGPVEAWRPNSELVHTVYWLPLHRIRHRRGGLPLFFYKKRNRFFYILYIFYSYCEILEALHCGCCTKWGLSRKSIWGVLKYNVRHGCDRYMGWPSLTVLEPRQTQELVRSDQVYYITPLNVVMWCNMT